MLAYMSHFVQHHFHETRHREDEMIYTPRSAHHPPHTGKNGAATKYHNPAYIQFSFRPAHPPFQERKQRIV